jgi:hypothetical protein
MPLGHFSNFIVQRGTIIMLAGIVLEPLIIGAFVPDMPMPAIKFRSIVMLVISFSPWFGVSHAAVGPSGDSRDDLAQESQAQ